MTYETDIPEYARQLARIPQRTPAQAVYHKEKIFYPGSRQQAQYAFEEDILVPDTKADMGEILFMNADCDVSPCEKKILPRVDDLLNLTGIITLQTLYNPEGKADCPVSIVSKIPYKYQWSMNAFTQAEGIFSCRVKSIEHRIINERKFRVRIVLEFSGLLFCEKEFDFFDGLQEDSLEMKKAEISFSCLSTVKKANVEIDEVFPAKEGNARVSCILRQNWEPVENYRQVTTEKIVINGFVLLSLLYLMEIDGVEALCSSQHKIEFTEFIPLDKQLRKKKWQAIDISFENGRLTSVAENDEETGESRVHTTGSFQIRVQLYEQKTQEMVIDAYHRTKDFQCRFQTESLFEHCGSFASDLSLREILSPPDSGRVTEAIYCECTVRELQCRAERGRLSFSGILQAECLWRDEGDTFCTTKHKIPIHHGMELEIADENLSVSFQPIVKSCELSLMNERQGELVVTIGITCQCQREKEFILLEEPVFQEACGEKRYAMVVAVKEAGVSLWDLAKRYRTTVEEIKSINSLEGEPSAERKLLMMK